MNKILCSFVFVMLGMCAFAQSPIQRNNFSTNVPGQSVIGDFSYSNNLAGFGTNFFVVNPGGIQMFAPGRNLSKWYGWANTDKAFDWAFSSSVLYTNGGANFAGPITGQSTANLAGPFKATNGIVGVTNMFGTNVLWVDPTTGDDTNGKIGDESRPYLTFLGAAIASPGVTHWCVLKPGTYNESIFSGAFAGVYCLPGVYLNNAGGNGINKNADNSDFKIFGYARVRAQGLAVSRSAGDNVGILTVECIELTGTNGAVGIAGGGTNWIRVIEALGGGVVFGDGAIAYTDTKVKLLTVTAPASFGGFVASGSNATLVVNVPWINSSGQAGVALLVGATCVGYGDIRSTTDAISMRTNCTVRWYGNLESSTDAALFAQGGGDIEVHGTVRNKSTTGFYQLAGSGCGIFNGASGGANIRIFGGVSAIMPIINENGTTEVYGRVEVTNTVAPVYSAYTAETLYNTAAFSPSDLQTNCLNAAINMVGSGKVLVRGDIYTPSNCVVRMSRTATGIVEIHDSTMQSTDGTRNTSTILYDGGTLRLSNVRLLSGTSFTNSISATNGIKLVEVYATSAADKPFNANALLTNGMIQISNVLQTTQPLQIDASDFSALPGVNIAHANNLATNYATWGHTNGLNAVISKGGINSNGVVFNQIAGSATAYPAGYTVFMMTANGANTNTTTTTNTWWGTGVGSRTLPANFWFVGRRLDIEMDGDWWDGAANAPERIMLMLNTSSATNIAAQVLASPPLSVTGGDYFTVKASMTCRTVGASGTIATSGSINWLKAGTSTPFAFTNLVLTIDTTVAQTCDLMSTNGATTFSVQPKNGSLTLR